MHLLLSLQPSGSLQVLRVKEGKNRIRANVKGEFGIGGRTNFVQKIHVFAILNKQYIAVARSAGLVQLYEKVLKPPGLDCSGSTTYKLVKEWKNSTTGPRDPIIGIGAFRNQYMYTCSGEGKLVIRDLINDDADDSVKLYIIDGPLSAVTIEAIPQSTHILVAAGGKGNNLKLYDFDFVTHDFASNFETIVNLVGHMTLIGLVMSVPEGRSLLRRSLPIRNSFVDVRRLVPVLDTTPSKTCAKKDSGAYWVLSTCFWKQGSDRMVFAGTQFGELYVYGIEMPYEFELLPRKVLLLSQFSINQLLVFNSGRYLFFSDSMSKAGVIDIKTLEVVNFYDYLRIGPSISSRVYTSEGTSKVSLHSNLSRFLPIYMIATTIDGAIRIYKLSDSNEKKLCFQSTNAGVIPNFDFLESDPYTRLNVLFGETFSQESNAQKPTESSSAKRRKATVSSSDANFIMHSSSHQGRNHNVLTTSHDHNNDGLVNDIKTMRLAN